MAEKKLDTDELMVRITNIIGHYGDTMQTETNQYPEYIPTDQILRLFEQYCRDNGIYQVKRIQPKYIANEYEFKEVKLNELS